MANEVIFENKPFGDDKTEPLRMEHFYFPLGLWFVGLLISLISFIAEIVIHRIRKSKSDVPLETQ